MTTHACTAIGVLIISFIGAAQPQEVQEKWPSGKPLIHGWMQDGRANGKWERYYESGQIAMSCTYANGLLDGRYVTYWPNGRQETVRTYRAGRRDGRSKEYYDTGELMADVTYQDGKPVEKHYLYHDGTAMNQTASALMEKVDNLDRINNVDAREGVQAYFDLAREHLITKHKREAKEILEKGVMIDAGNCEGQLALARLEVEAKELTSAQIRLRFIVEHTKDRALSKAARDLLSIPALQRAADPPTRLTLKSRILYLLPTSDADSRLVQTVFERLKTDFGVRVILLRPIDLADTTLQDSQLTYLRLFVTRAFAEKKPEDAAELARRAGVDINKELSAEDMRRVVKTYMLQKGGRDDWDETSALLDSQFDAHVIAEQVADRARQLLGNPTVLGILTITSKDIRADTHRFVFGTCVTALHVAVMSYDRFEWGRPSFEVLQKRTVMQGLSSAGFLIGLGRCTTPSCARAYPNSVIEQDRKDDRMCPTCLANLRSLYRRMSAQDPPAVDEKNVTNE